MYILLQCNRIIRPLSTPDSDLVNLHCTARSGGICTAAFTQKYMGMTPLTPPPVDMPVVTNTDICTHFSSLEIETSTHCAEWSQFMVGYLFGRLT